MVTTANSDNSIKTIETTVETAAEASPLPSKAAQRNFYHAWLAYCVNGWTEHDVFSYPKPQVTKMAKKRIEAAIADSTIIAAYGQDSLVWGPYLVVDDEGPEYYTLKNLMYCVKSTVNGAPYYSVGIAGTNMISHYDWFDEDFDVSTTKPWTPGGNISNGSNTGCGILVPA